jgi:hypothetical protein
VLFCIRIQQNNYFVWKDGRMKVITYILIGICVIGLITGHLGAALLALLCAGCAWLFARELDKTHAAQKQDPYWVKPNPDTLQELERQEAECSRSHF